MLLNSVEIFLIIESTQDEYFKVNILKDILPSFVRDIPGKQQYLLLALSMMLTDHLLSTAVCNLSCVYSYISILFWPKPSCGFDGFCHSDQSKCMLWNDTITVHQNKKVINLIQLISYSFCVQDQLRGLCADLPCVMSKAILAVSICSSWYLILQNYPVEFFFVGALCRTTQVKDIVYATVNFNPMCEKICSKINCFVCSLLCLGANESFLAWHVARWHLDHLVKIYKTLIIKLF